MVALFQKAALLTGRFYHLNRENLGDRHEIEPKGVLLKGPGPRTKAETVSKNFAIKRLLEPQNVKLLVN